MYDILGKIVYYLVVRDRYALKMYTSNSRQYLLEQRIIANPVKEMKQIHKHSINSKEGKR